MFEFIKDNMLVILLCIGTIYTFMYLMRYHEKLKITWWTTLLISVLHTVIGVMCVKVFAVMETLDFSKAGSMSLFGAVFFLPVIYLCGAKLFKRNIALIFDVFTPCVIFTLLCARINCIISGCCLGDYIFNTQYRYPTREVEIVFYIVLLVYLWSYEKKSRPLGTMYPLYMSAYGIFRFICEFFRNSESKNLFHISHLWAMIAFLVGISIYVELNSHSKKKNNNNSHP